MIKREALFISIAVFVFSLLRIPSLVEPYWYGDEGIYQIVGMALRRGRILYEGIWDNKPPLLYIIYALFDGDLFYVRLLSLIFGVASIIIFFLLAKKLFKNIISVFISTAVYACLFAIPLLEGNIANAENFMHLPILLAFYLVVSSSSKNRFLLTFVSGILLSVAFLTKIVAIFDIASLFLFIFILKLSKDVKLSWKNISHHAKGIITAISEETILSIGFLSPIIITILYFLFVEAFPDFARAVFSQNVGYVGYGNFFLFPMGLLYLKFFLLILSTLLVIRYRKYLGPAGILILVWLIFSVFNAFFSQRPYTHYLLVMLPPLALFSGYVLDNKKLVKIMLPLLIVIILLVLQVFRLNFRKIIPYYSNYLSFVLNNKSVESYQAFFDKNTPRDYAIANFVKAKTSRYEEVFLWGDSAQIYVLAGKLPPGRYTVSYHITFYKDAILETREDISRKKPKYIVQIKDSPEVYNFLDDYDLRYKLDSAKGIVNIYERQF